MQKRIFIGSSLEPRDLAGLLQETLSKEFECVLWYEDFFSLGNHYYADLLI
jgi:predicted nucleotide-binding protein